MERLHSFQGLVGIKVPARRRNLAFNLRLPPLGLRFGLPLFRFLANQLLPSRIQQRLEILAFRKVLGSALEGSRCFFRLI